MTPRDAGDLSRDELVRACLRGDDAAWRRFLERYGALITTVVVRSGIPRGEAEEPYQRTVLAIYEGLANLREPAKLVSWIAGIARHHALSYRRRMVREVETAEETFTALLDEVPLPDAEMEAVQRGQLLSESLSELRERCRALLSALYLSDPPVSYKEIEETHGIAYGSIGPTRARCLDALRTVLVRRHYPWGGAGGDR